MADRKCWITLRQSTVGGQMIAEWKAETMTKMSKATLRAETMQKKRNLALKTDGGRCDC